MRERLGFGLGYDGSMDVRRMATLMRQAEDRGFDLGFFSETIELMRDSVTALAAFALATTRMTLGATQIVRLRTPIVMAQTLASLDELSGGRMVLSPGAFTRSHATRHGLEHRPPLETLREWMEAMRLVLSGKLASYAGRHVQFQDVQLPWTPVRARVPMWNPASSPAGLRLAGEIGDGVVLNACTSPEYSANAIRVMREAAGVAGRDGQALEVAQLVVCSIEDDRERAIEAVRWEVASKFHPRSLSITRRRLATGEPHVDPADFPMLEEAFREGDKDGLARALPVSYVEHLTASGTADDVRRRVQAYRDAGVTLPILRPAHARQAERLLDVFARPPSPGRA
jgi:alkanesulfonate monooxygenase SsuD/methylene tetrahydromethanopterin reductase-like flavin-dependent oxidoreductase (luciferase family)